MTLFIFNERTGNNIKIKNKQLQFFNNKTKLQSNLNFAATFTKRTNTLTTLSHTEYRIKRKPRLKMSVSLVVL